MSSSDSRTTNQANLDPNGYFEWLENRYPQLQRLNNQLLENYHRMSTQDRMELTQDRELLRGYQECLSDDEQLLRIYQEWLSKGREELIRYQEELSTINILIRIFN
ncbi:MAG: hypothetical protein MHMPM18_002162 [Marteilia pararefringens]